MSELKLGTDPATFTPKVTNNPNYCFRIVKKKDGLGKIVDQVCGGQIFVWTIDMQNDGSAIVNSKCGGCEAKETDTFSQPEIKHSGICLQNQKILNKKPEVHLATVVPDVLWKCSGVRLNEEDEDGKKFCYCDGLAVDLKGGFPF